MGEIIILALAAAVFPLLLGCVAILISRPEPRPLMLAFYAGGMITSITSGLIVLSLFNSGDDALGSTSSTPHAGLYILGGLVALLLAWLMASRRGRGMIDGWRSRHPGKPKPSKEDKGPSWAERTLGRANAWIAFAVGAAINLPGPYYLIALGDISSSDYSSAQELALILLFNLVMFVLLEVPLVGYLFRPEATTARVTAFSNWLNANGLRVMGWFVGLFGVGLLVQGISAAAG